MRSKKSLLGEKQLASPYVVWSLVFVVAPMFFVLYYSFTNAEGAFTFANILALGKYKEVLLRSVWMGLVATVICLFLAYPIAYAVAHMTENVQRTMIMLVMLPMWMSFLIRTYAWMTLLQDTGIINTFLGRFGMEPIHMINTQGAVILGMVYNYLPFMILPLYSVMAKMDGSLLEAAHDLGANGLSVLRKVILPLSLPGIATGITMVFVPCVSTFYISQKLGGGSFDMVGDTIERQFREANNYNLGAALSLVLMVLILLSMAFMRRFTDDDEEAGIL